MNALLRLASACLAAMAFGCSGAAEDRSLATEQSDALSANAARPITILHVNDSHSTLDSMGPKDANLDGTLGGLTRAATVMQRIRRGTPNTLFLHAGDVFEGDLVFPATGGVLEMQLLKQLGLDAMTLGNHEFDYGPGVLAGSLAAAGFDSVAVLSANLVKPADPHPLSSLVTGHVVKEVRGVRVGIFGLTTDDLLEQTGPFSLDPAVDDIVAREVAALRSPPANADVVILLSHMHATVDHRLANKPSNGIDFIVGGHDEFDETFTSYQPGKTMVVRAGHFYQRVGKLDLVVKKGRVLDAKHSLIPIDQSVERDRRVSAAVSAVKQEINDSLGIDAFNQQVAFAPRDLENEWNESMGPRVDFGVGDVAADALKTELGADIGLTTSGFLNDRIYQGPVVANDLFRALPYGISPRMLGESFPDGILPDPVLKVELNGAQLYTGLEFALEAGEIPQVSEGTFICYDASASPQLQFIALDGSPVLPDMAKHTVGSNIFIISVVDRVLERFPDLGEFDIPDFDPMVSQFSVLLQYAAGKTLTLPEQPRVLNTTSCMDLLPH